MLGWREWASSDGSGLLPVDPESAPVSTALGVLGMTGFTAYHGLLEIGRPQGGRRSSSPARPARSAALVGQIAKLSAAAG